MKELEDTIVFLFFRDAQQRAGMTLAKLRQLWIQTEQSAPASKCRGSFTLFHFLKGFIYFFLERGERREKEGEKYV